MHGKAGRERARQYTQLAARIQPPRTFCRVMNPSTFSSRSIFVPVYALQLHRVEAVFGRVVVVSEVALEMVELHAAVELHPEVGGRRSRPAVLVAVPLGPFTPFTRVSASLARWRRRRSA